MKYTVDIWNNFCRVFELPEEYIDEFCFGKGHHTNFQMVDWFCPTDMGQAACSKEVYLKEVGEIKTREVTLDELFNSLVPFLKDKIYVHNGKKYLVICDFGAAFIFDSTSEAAGKGKR
jgi:hypothetical protein